MILSKMYPFSHKNTIIPLGSYGYTLEASNSYKDFREYFFRTCSKNLNPFETNDLQAGSDYFKHTIRNNTDDEPHFNHHTLHPGNYPTGNKRNIRSFENIFLNKPTTIGKYFKTPSIPRVVKPTGNITRRSNKSNNIEHASATTKGKRITSINDRNINDNPTNDRGKTSIDTSPLRRNNLCKSKILAVKTQKQLGNISNYFSGFFKFQLLSILNATRDQMSGREGGAEEGVKESRKKNRSFSSNVINKEIKKLNLENNLNYIGHGALNCAHFEHNMEDIINGMSYKNGIGTGKRLHKSRNEIDKTLCQNFEKKGWHRNLFEKNILTNKKSFKDSGVVDCVQWRVGEKEDIAIEQLEMLSLVPKIDDETKIDDKKSKEERRCLRKWETGKEKKEINKLKKEKSKKIKKNEENKNNFVANIDSENKLRKVETQIGKEDSDDEVTDLYDQYAHNVSYTSHENNSGNTHQENNEAGGDGVFDNAKDRNEACGRIEKEKKEKEKREDKKEEKETKEYKENEKEKEEKDEEEKKDNLFEVEEDGFKQKGIMGQLDVENKKQKRSFGKKFSTSMRKGVMDGKLKKVKMKMDTMPTKSIGEFDFKEALKRQKVGKKKEKWDKKQKVELEAIHVRTTRSIDDLEILELKEQEENSRQSQLSLGLPTNEMRGGTVTTMRKRSGVMDKRANRETEDSEEDGKKKGGKICNAPEPAGDWWSDVEVRGWVVIC